MEHALLHRTRLRGGATLQLAQRTGTSRRERNCPRTRSGDPRRDGLVSKMTPRTVLRVARPTDRLADLVRFYTEGLGLTQLDAFSDHDGFDGVMLGAPGGLYHLEFTHH